MHGALLINKHPGVSSFGVIEALQRSLMEQRGLKRTDGHAAGEEALFDTVEGALELGLRWMTVYAFSTENWRRPADEVRFLMRFNERLLLERRDELHEKGVRVRFAGRRDWRVPKRVLKRMAGREGGLGAGFREDHQGCEPGRVVAGAGIESQVILAGLREGTNALGPDGGGIAERLPLDREHRRVLGRKLKTEKRDKEAAAQ